ncbi:MAG: hypothetical protein A2521_08560 [Deltaproteobacteria bacterium RIFOXYD12_FULL_57_12]|nr:MAG: hypothetical protein A2521_08560 [Deltaproteobacteria bacterium RIFOXYD12_FULL_57_12]
MTQEPKKIQPLNELAQEAIDTIVTIATRAKNQLKSMQYPSHGDVFVGPNTAHDNLARIKFQEKENLKILANEPVIARVVATTEDGKQQIYYISRSTPLQIPGSQAKFASYRAPIGRLAAIPVGDDVALQIGKRVKSFEVLARTKLHPIFDEEWDSCNNTVEDYNGLVTIPSFRNFLAKSLIKADSRDLLKMLLEEEEAGGAIIEGLRRSVIDRMQLRDQPILDQYQDEIFRLPLDSQLLILGPPGTGKTTTLIRRLGQKLDITFLSEDESDLIKHVQTTHSLPHEQSWVMFSPTELLKLYIKEAFNREGIPAPEERIRTWTDTRRHLARNVLGILKSGMGGVLTLSDNESVLRPSAIEDAIGWFEDFRAFFLADIQLRFQQAVDWLIEADDSRVVDLALRAKKILATTGSGEKKAISIAVIRQLSILEQEISSILQSYGDILRSTRDGWIANILQTEKEFLDNFAGVLDSLQRELINEPLDEDDEGDEGDDDSFQTQRIASLKRRKAYREYSAAMNRWARAKYAGKTLSPNSKASRIISWLGERLPPESDLLKSGSMLEIQTRLRELINPVKIFLAQIPSRYLHFRKVRMKEGIWYLDQPAMEVMVKNRVITGFELDILVLLMLRHAGELLVRLPRDEIEEKVKYSILQTIRAEYRHQVLVDEASDFSPVQLACMMELSHPSMRSFFACGDFLQRVTRHGLRDKSQIEWVSKGIELRPVAIAYRQSQRLTKLAKSIATLGGGVIDLVTSPPAYQDNEGELPILAENIADKDLANWLGARICEVEQCVGTVPSIAIFVDSEPAVEPLTKDLSEVLQKQNIQVVSCPQGRVMGQDGAVRVFDVQHIKGLEFEAVFFVGADRLANREPDIFTKFLYVGATRAATYFGITCDGKLPPLMENLREKFGESWAGLA